LPSATVGVGTIVMVARHRYNRTIRTMMRRSSPKSRKTKPRPRDRQEPAETRASEAVTIAWTVSVTGVFVADLIVVAAHLYARSGPPAQPARALEAIMLLSAATMGAASLALLAVVWRTRRVKPPQGYMAFATCVAAAPIVVLSLRLLS
jgi:hypothetical protein